MRHTVVFFPLHLTLDFIKKLKLSQSNIQSRNIVYQYISSSISLLYKTRLKETTSGVCVLTSIFHKYIVDAGWNITGKEEDIQIEEVNDIPITIRLINYLSISFDFNLSLRYFS